MKQHCLLSESFSPFKFKSQRFGGATFPPIVLFKVYTSMAPKREGWGCEEAEPEVREVLGRDMRAVAGRGGRIQYINGLKMITPHSKVPWCSVKVRKCKWAVICIASLLMYRNGVCY